LRVARADDRGHAADADRLDQLKVSQFATAQDAAEQVDLRGWARLNLGDDRGRVIGGWNDSVEEGIGADLR